MVLDIQFTQPTFSYYSSFQNAQRKLDQTSNRLATMVRINQASDDPAGLILVESLNDQISAQEAALSANEASQAWASVADSGLSNASNLLAQVHTDLVTAANGTLTADEREALQVEIDASLDALNRIGQSTWGDSAVYGSTTTFLAGDTPSSTESVTLPAIDDSLGGASGTLSELRSGGTANAVTGDLETAAAIVQEAQQQVLSARASLGAFQSTTLDSVSRVLESSLENLTAARSAVQDTNVAEAMSDLSRYSVLTKIASLAMIRSQKQRLALVDLLLSS